MRAKRSSPQSVRVNRSAAKVVGDEQTGYTLPLRSTSRARGSTTRTTSARRNTGPRKISRHRRSRPMQIRQAIPTNLLAGTISLRGRQIRKRTLLPVGIAVFAIIGVFSPLFDLHTLHGIPSAKLYTQHLYFDAIGDAGGYYAATFCTHWYHRIPIAVGIALLSTLALVTVIG